MNTAAYALSLRSFVERCLLGFAFPPQLEEEYRRAAHLGDECTRLKGTDRFEYVSILAEMQYVFLAEWATRAVKLFFYGRSREFRGRITAVRVDADLKFERERVIRRVDELDRMLGESEIDPNIIYALCIELATSVDSVECEQERRNRDLFIARVGAELQRQPAMSLLTS